MSAIYKQAGELHQLIPSDVQTDPLFAIDAKVRKLIEARGSRDPAVRHHLPMRRWLRRAMTHDDRRHRYAAPQP